MWIFHGDRAYVRKFQKEAGEEEPGYDRSQQSEGGWCRIWNGYQHRDIDYQSWRTAVREDVQGAGGGQAVRRYFPA